MATRTLLRGASQHITQTSWLHPRLTSVLVIAWWAVVLWTYYTQLWQLLVTRSFNWPRLAGDPRLPYFSEAVQRAVGGMISMGALMACALLLGLAICRLSRWRFDSWRERLVITAALGIGGWAFLGLGLAAAGMYRVGVLRALVAMTLLSGIGWWMMQRRPLPDLRSSRVGEYSRSAWLWIGTTILAVSCAFIAALAPEREYDALWYHLAYPQRYLQVGQLVDISSDYVSLYPMTWELWFGYGLAVGGQTAATLLHFACLILVALLTYEATRRYVSHASPWLAVALLVTVPTVMWEASTAYIDLALALHVCLALYSVLRYVSVGRQQWLIISALNLGIALATKHLALVVLGLIATGLFFRLWRSQRNLWKALPPIVALGCLSLLLPLPWYLRSWFAAGNPVFPELYGLFGAPPERWDAVTQQGLERFLDHFGRPRTLVNQLTLPWHMTIHAAAYHGSLGPLFLLLLPWLALRRWRGETVWLAAFAAGYIAVWASPLASFQLRFLIPLAPVLAILAAAAYARLGATLRSVFGRTGATTLAGITCVLLVLNLPPFTALHERDRIEWEGWLNSTLHGLPLGVVVGAESRDEYLTRTVSSYAAWQFANRTLPADARVLTWSGGDHFYSRHDRIWANATAMRAVAWAVPREAEQAIGQLRDLGITHLIIDRRPDDSPDGWEQFALTHSTTRSVWYDMLYEDHHYILYRLRGEPVDIRHGALHP